MRRDIALITAKLMAIPPSVTLMLCSGNHDSAFDREEETPEWLSRLVRKRPNTFCDGDRVTKNGATLEIVGWGQSPTKAADFYVIHSPPAEARTARCEGNDWGSFELSCHLTLFEGIALCGHVHAPEKWYDLRAGAKSLNPAVGDVPCYNTGRQQDAPALPPHVVIDLVSKVATRGSERIQLSW